MTRNAPPAGSHGPEPEGIAMNKPLSEATMGEPLSIARMTDPDLAVRLGRMGLFEGSGITRLDREVLVQPVRVRGPLGETVLGGGMAMKIVVHLDDGRKMPLIEMTPGESGHVEGLTGGPDLSDTMGVLGLNANDRIVFVRRLPPMEYLTVIPGGGRLRLTEGMAAKIWGRLRERSMQFVSARAGEAFLVDKVLGGNHAARMLAARGIRPGISLVLESVAQAQSLQLDTHNPVIVTSHEGLRLFLTPADAQRILVRRAGPEG